MKKYWKLPKADLELWLEALRSGEYDQCSGVLHKPGEGYCCLGVFARIKLGDNFKEENYHEAGLSSIHELQKFEVLLASRPNSLFDILTAFNDGNTIFIHPDKEIMRLPEIVKHNRAGNTSSKSFEFIANFLEKYVEAV